ncbi:HAMP domain-containing sensor histidine kinase [Aquabacter sp. CN5-332]|uniref:GAF domain-containing sensor histidine kinase n=1 Tax=Aquabacter sp. CN5-332 TaxID=3156608 RepID=UPI0032B59F9F
MERAAAVPHDYQADIDAISRIPAVAQILDVVCETTGMGFSAVARVTEQRWIACNVRDRISFGLTPGGELEVRSTICHEIRASREAVIIDHVAEDQEFCQHHTPLRYGFQSYISMPIILADGTFWGTLCAIDPHPRKLNNPTIVNMFKLFAELIGYHLNAEERFHRTEAALVDERTSSELREQFIAVLGHDLRNPLASIDAGVRLLSRKLVDEESRSITNAVQGSVRRMALLISDVMDFARGRLGGGIAVFEQPDIELGELLEPVIEESRAAHPDRRIVSKFAIHDTVRCDPSRMQQVLSNLVANALIHGSAASPIDVWAATNGGTFELSVTNAGEQISPAVMADLFKPFVRERRSASKQGLGLGLYICSEIAKAHGGTLTATSSPSETRFTLRIPMT